MVFILVMSLTQGEIDDMARKADRFDEYVSMADEAESEAEGLLDRLAASYIAASRLGMDLASAVPVVELGGEMSATVYGVLRTAPVVTTYNRKSGKEGKMMKFVMGDATGDIDVVVWDEKMVDELAAVDIDIGTRIKVANGRTKENRYGRQITPGKWGTVIVEPGDFREMEAKPRKKRITPLSDISVGGTYSVKGEVMTVFELRQFQRRSGSSGWVLNVIISDDTGSMKVVLWDEMARKYAHLDRGHVAEFSDMSARQNRDIVELHSTYRTKVEMEMN